MLDVAGGESRSRFDVALAKLVCRVQDSVAVSIARVTVAMR
jgi:hypothetical protein